MTALSFSLFLSVYWFLPAGFVLWHYNKNRQDTEGPLSLSVALLAVGLSFFWPIFLVVEVIKRLRS